MIGYQDSEQLEFLAEVSVAMDKINADNNKNSD